MTEWNTLLLRKRKKVWRPLIAKKSNLENMEASNGQNASNDQISNIEDCMENHTVIPNKNNDNTNAGDSFCCWKSPLKCVINIAQFLERAKIYSHLVKEGGLLLEPP